VTRPARILLVTPQFPPSLGGVERHVERLATGLSRRRLDVEVATTDPTEPSPTIEELGSLVIRRFPTIRREGVFLLSPRLALWLLLEAGRFDLVHAHSYHTPFALVSAVAARVHRVPLVVTPHYHGTGHTRARRVLHRPYRRLGAWMIRQAALVLCNSEAEGALIRRDFGAGLRIKVVLPGVGTSGTRPAIDASASNGRTILAGGRLEGYKQVEVVVRALGQLPPEFHLVVFGEGPDLDQIAAAAREVGVSPRVEFVGRVTDEDLERRFRTADVFVSLSRKEAFGLTVLEAAAAGTAVVCSDIPAYREMAGRLPQGALRLLDVDADPGVVAQSIRAAAEGPRPTAPLASNLPSWEAMVAGVLEGYREVLAGRGRSSVGV
jgi:glycosyltransferase involved in cell wall biosynthesis